VTVVRTLTSVLPTTLGRVTFTAQGAADAGSMFDVAVSPASFRIRGKQSQKVAITVKARADTPLDKYQFGQVSCCRKQATLGTGVSGIGIGVGVCMLLIGPGRLQQGGGSRGPQVQENAAHECACMCWCWPTWHNPHLIHSRQ
jgi:hypothetical protein